jgi:predicted nuclease with TOPRIM domain
MRDCKINEERDEYIGFLEGIIVEEEKLLKLLTDDETFNETIYDRLEFLHDERNDLHQWFHENGFAVPPI